MKKLVPLFAVTLLSVASLHATTLPDDTQTQDETTPPLCLLLSDDELKEESPGNQTIDENEQKSLPPTLQALFSAKTRGLPNDVVNSLLFPDAHKNEAHELHANRSSKHQTRTLYMVSTGALREFLPDPASHRRHGPALATYSLLICSSIAMALLFTAGKYTGAPLFLGIVSTLLASAGLYTVFFDKLAQQDRQMIVDFLRHEWPELQKEISFPESFTAVLDKLYHDLNTGKLNIDLAVRCIDALQNSGQHE